MPRNSSGVYTLPTGNPVVSGTTIATTWANNTMSDVGSEITNSLDRSGRGGMLAALKGTDGSQAAPAYSFTNEPSSGFYRLTGGEFGVTVLNTAVGNWQADGYHGNIFGNVTGTITGHSSLDVLKAGDTMTGPLVISLSTAITGLSISDSFVGAGNTNLFNLTNSTDSDLIFALSQVGAASKFAAIRPSVNTQLRLGSGNTDFVYINFDGRVGIGAAPSQAGIPFQVTGAGAYVDLETTTTGFSAIFGRDAGTLRWSVGQNGFGGADGVSLYTGAANIERFKIAGTGTQRTLQLTNAAQGELVIGPSGAPSFTVPATRANLTINGSGGEALLGFGTSANLNSGYLFHNGSNFTLNNAIGQLLFATSNVTAMTITAGGVIQESASGFELGYKSLNRNIYNSGASTIAAVDNGRCHWKADATNVLVPTGLADGLICNVYNASGSARTIVQNGGVTLILAGTASTGNRTLAPNGLATIWSVGSNTVIINGSGVT